MTRDELMQLEGNDELKAYIASMEIKAGLFIEGIGTKFSDGRHVEMQRFTTGVVFAFKDRDGRTECNWISDEAMYMLMSFYARLYNESETHAQYLKCCELTGTKPEVQQ